MVLRTYLLSSLAMFPLYHRWLCLLAKCPICCFGILLGFGFKELFFPRNILLVLLKSVPYLLSRYVNPLLSGNIPSFPFQGCSPLCFLGTNPCTFQKQLFLEIDISLISRHHFFGIFPHLLPGMPPRPNNVLCAF